MNTPMTARELPELLPCPFCGGAVQFRKALHTSDGNTDSIIHDHPSNCGLTDFDVCTTDERTVIAAWNTRQAGTGEAVPVAWRIRFGEDNQLETDWAKMDGSLWGYTHDEAKRRNGSIEYRYDAHQPSAAKVTEFPAYVSEALRQFADALDASELDGAGRYRPESLRDWADEIDASASHAVTRQAGTGEAKDRYSEGYSDGAAAARAALATDAVGDKAVAWVVSWQAGPGKRASKAFTAAQEAEAREYFEWRNLPYNEATLTPAYAAAPQSQPVADEVFDVCHENGSVGLFATREMAEQVVASAGAGVGLLICSRRIIRAAKYLSAAALTTKDAAPVTASQRERILEVLRPWLDTGDSRTAADFAVSIAAILCEDEAAAHQPSGDRDGVVDEVLAELAKAVQKFPTWPTDPLHALAVLGEEYGELNKAVLQTVYEPHKVKPGEVRTEAKQTAAMALRFLMSLDRYEYTPGEQHQQRAIASTGEKGNGA